jgi:hypothetical protein
MGVLQVLAVVMVVVLLLLLLLLLLLRHGAACYPAKQAGANAQQADGQMVTGYA